MVDCWDCLIFFFFSSESSGAYSLVCFQDIDKRDESAQNAESKKKGDSDTEDEEQDSQPKEKGLSNKKKKVLLFHSCVTFC